MKIEDAAKHYMKGGIIKGMNYVHNTVLCYYEPMKEFHMVEACSTPATKEVDGWVRIGTRQELSAYITNKYKYINARTSKRCKDILVSTPDSEGNIVVLMQDGKYALAAKEDIKISVNPVEAWQVVKELVEGRGYTIHEAYETLTKEYEVI